MRKFVNVYIQCILVSNVFAKGVNLVHMTNGGLVIKCECAPCDCRYPP